MEMLIVSLSTLGDDWRAWVVAGLVTLKAVVSVYFLMRCPVQNGTYQVPRELAVKSAEFKFNAPLSYLGMMLLGIGLAIGGLYLLNDPHWGPLALGVVVIGVFIFMTEPSRLRVNNSRIAVFAASLANEEAVALARDDLRDAQKQRAMFELTIAVALIMALTLT
ncbi:MAG: hypothetical protein ACPGFA_07395 [Pikeienuella sp.]